MTTATVRRRLPVAEPPGRPSASRCTVARTRPAGSGRRLEGEEDRVLTPPHEEEDVLALLAGAQRLAVVVRVLDGLAIHLENDVAATQTGILRRASRLDRGDDDALRVLDTEV